MLYAPMPGDIDATCAPDLVMLLYIIQKTCQGGGAARFADQPAMQSDRHHSWRLGTFCVELVEGVFQVVEKLGTSVETLGRGEAHIVHVQGVWDNELWVVELCIPIGEVIGVRVSVVDKTVVLSDKSMGIRAGAA